MTTSVQDTDSAAAIHRINDTLRGPVIDMLARFLPELRNLPKAEAYDRTLDDLGLLSRCFEAFRRERRHFRFLVVDAQRRTVTDDVGVLSCGRTVQEVVAMVVRTAAKRYFRRALEPMPGRRRPASAKPSPADELYDAIKDHLMHEWQVPLVPVYADMSPALVRALGARLITVRTAAELRVLMTDPAAVDRLLTEDAAAEIAAPPAPVDASVKLLRADGQRLNAEAFTNVLLSPEVRAQLPNASQVLRVTDILRDVGGVPARLLLTGLKLSAAQLAVLIINAHATTGSEVFLRVFGQPGQPEMVLRVIERGLAGDIGPETSLADMATFIRQLFSRTRRNTA
jgi:hypothetical protein